MVVLALGLSPTLLTRETTNKTFYESGKQNSFIHIMKSSASMYESPGSQFFRNTSGIQSGPDAFDELRFVMTFLTILEIKDVLCSLILVLEGNMGKEN